MDTNVYGVASTFNAPQRQADRIDDFLASKGWRASLINRTAKLLRADGGRWTYKIRLHPGRAIEEELSADSEEKAPSSAASVSAKPDYSPGNIVRGAAL